MEIIIKTIEVQGVLINYQTVTVDKNKDKTEELISQGYWKAVEAGDTYTFIKIINYR